MAVAELYPYDGGFKFSMDVLDAARKSPARGEES
jgi:hypothetical protein